MTDTNSGVEAFPLAWPFGKPRTKRPQPARFKVRFAKARDELMSEIEKLGGKMPILSSNVPLRNDGLPYASQSEPADRGVAVYFMLHARQYCFACDRWDKVGDNIQAARHTIAALRGIERWGTGDMLQAAFTGFAALPNPENPYTVLGVKESATQDEVNAAYRAKVKELHPDNGGNADAFNKVINARTKLRGVGL